uniref:Uncharacterized protein n=1 Tax=Glossina brevipalpis TaxID=37001 RepID=A0A1A9WK50_9MUSC
MPFGRKSPLEALALPGVILAYKYSQFRQRRREAASRRVTERELSALHHKIVSQIYIQWIVAIYLTGILEYLIAKILQLVGNASKDLKTKRITPRHLEVAIRADS